MIIKQNNIKKEGILNEDDNIISALNFDLESKESIDSYINDFDTNSVRLWIEKVYDKYKKIEDYIV